MTILRKLWYRIFPHTHVWTRAIEPPVGLPKEKYCKRCGATRVVKQRKPK